MRLYEFTEFNKIDLESVDLVDDLHFFMHNDPTFYRKIFFPHLHKFKHIIKAGKKCSPKHFKNLIDQAADIYCKKYKIPKVTMSVFSSVDRDQLASKIFNQELDHIKTGAYDRRDDE